MDPCPFVRILVGNLALKFLVSSKSSSSDCYCRIKLKNFPDQDAQIPLIQQQNSTQEPNVSSLSNSLAACFSFNKSQIEKILQENKGSSKSSTLMIDVYSGGSGASCVTGHKLLGRVSVPLDLRGADAKVSTLHNGWMAIGGNKKSSSPELYLTVKAEPDPRFVFQFGGEPECSPQVFQVQGSVKQAVFTCKFGFRNSGGDRNLVSRSSMNEPSSPRNWLPTFGGEKDQSSKERKGWSITVHDLSADPTPVPGLFFAPVTAPGNPGAVWRPGGNPDAPTPSDTKFDLFQDAATTTSASTTVANSTLSCTKGGKFIIDRTTSLCATPVTSPHSSIDFGSGSWSGSGSGSDFSFCFLPPQSIYKGFVMSSTVGKSSKPEVEVGVQHVTCTEDAAAFVALAAAMDLSMDACRLFSQKLRKELRQQSQQCVV
ncbi:hypothetical protein Patl1_37292 [Pistacia atlantica]|nr:hypothetical protein Patl1_37292 [Pistacia atlantica]